MPEKLPPSELPPVPEGEPANELGYHPTEHNGYEDHGDRQIPFAYFNGCKIKLAAMPPRGLMCAPRLQEAFQVIPDAKLVPTKRPAGVPILNQQSTSSCVGHAGAGGVMSARVRAGGKPVTLAPFFLYAHICGGRDAGANLGDAVESLRADGISLQSQVPNMVLRPSRLPDEAVKTAENFKLSEVWACPTRGEIKTALCLGYDVFFAMYAGGRFMSGQLDDEGVAPLAAFPNWPNHALYMSWLRALKNGRWGYGTNNSWDRTWGDNGTCTLVDEHLPSDGRIEAYAFKTVSVSSDAAFDDIPPVPIV
jgi:hypothetical protein